MKIQIGILTYDCYDKTKLTLEKFNEVCSRNNAIQNKDVYVREECYEEVKTKLKNKFMDLAMLGYDFSKFEEEDKYRLIIEKEASRYSVKGLLQIAIILCKRYNELFEELEKMKEENQVEIVNLGKYIFNTEEEYDKAYDELSPYLLGN
jgi:hypothetical protein